MKVNCPKHGVHFGDEVGDITACTFYWQQFGLQGLPQTAKQEMAEWLVQIPADKIFGETGWGIAIALKGEYIGQDQALATQEWYKNMTEEERRAYQREQTLGLYKPNKLGGIRRWLIRRLAKK